MGAGKADLGSKSMINILAAKDEVIDLKSFGTLLVEPPTGLVSFDASCIAESFITQICLGLIQIFKSSVQEKLHNIFGKYVGYIGHFGKVMVVDLAR